MEIPAPKHPIDHPAYNADLQEALDYPVLDFVDRIGAAGWSKREAFKALAEVIRNQALAYEEDPDPEDDASELGEQTTIPGRSEMVSSRAAISDPDSPFAAVKEYGS